MHGETIKVTLAVFLHIQKEFYARTFTVLSYVEPKMFFFLIIVNKAVNT